MSLESIATFISNVGFPIAMCAYFILRMENIIKGNTETINKLLEKSERSKYGIGIYKVERGVRIKESENKS